MERGFDGDLLIAEFRASSRQDRRDEPLQNTTSQDRPSFQEPVCRSLGGWGVDRFPPAIPSPPRGRFTTCSYRF